MMCVKGTISTVTTPASSQDPHRLPA
jgi:hypothetical protein